MPNAKEGERARLTRVVLCYVMLCCGVVPREVELALDGAPLADDAARDMAPGEFSRKTEVARDQFKVGRFVLHSFCIRSTFSPPSFQLPNFVRAQRRCDGDS